MARRKALKNAPKSGMARSTKKSWDREGSAEVGRRWYQLRDQVAELSIAGAVEYRTSGRKPDEYYEVENLIQAAPAHWRARLGAVSRTAIDTFLRGTRARGGVQKAASAALRAAKQVSPPRAPLRPTGPTAAEIRQERRKADRRSGKTRARYVKAAGNPGKKDWTFSHYETDEEEGYRAPVFWLMGHRFVATLSVQSPKLVDLEEWLPHATYHDMGEFVTEPLSKIPKKARDRILAQDQRDLKDAQRRRDRRKTRTGKGSRWKAKRNPAALLVEAAVAVLTTYAINKGRRKLGEIQKMDHEQRKQVVRDTMSQAWKGGPLPWAAVKALKVVGKDEAAVSMIAIKLGDPEVQEAAKQALQEADTYAAAKNPGRDPRKAWIRDFQRPLPRPLSKMKRAEVERELLRRVQLGEKLNSRNADLPRERVQSETLAELKAHLRWYTSDEAKAIFGKWASMPYEMWLFETSSGTQARERRLSERLKRSRAGTPKRRGRGRGPGGGTLL